MCFTLCDMCTCVIYYTYESVCVDGAGHCWADKVVLHKALCALLTPFLSTDVYSHPAFTNHSKG